MHGENDEVKEEHPQEHLHYLHHQSKVLSRGLLLLADTFYKVSCIYEVKDAASDYNYGKQQ